jgi:hypothetical protein
MVVNKLTINVDAAWIEQFNAGGMKLCFASAVDAAGSSRYNVVAYADSQLCPVSSREHSS